MVVALLALLLAGAGYAAPQPRVRVVAVDPDTPMMNPNGRLLLRGHPARFQVQLENPTAELQEGTLVAQAEGDLDAVYEVWRERLSLAPGQKRAVSVTWAYPADVIFPDLPWGPVTRPGASWGHALTAAWLDAGGRTVDEGATTFAIARDGLPDEAPRPQRTAPLPSARAAFDLRYSGYLANPAFGPQPDGDPAELEIGGQMVTGMRCGLAPSGYQTYLVTLPPVPRAVNAVLRCGPQGRRLQQAWLLEPEAPEGPQARRLYHLGDGLAYRFTLPRAPAPATLVLETAVTHRYIAPVPLTEIAATGAKQFGPVRSPLVTPEGQKIASREQWEARRQQLRATIWKALGTAPEPASTRLQPVTVSEQQIGAQAWPTGVTRPYVRRKVSIQVRPGETMNLWLLVPPGPGPFPAVIALHQTVAEGKDEPVGLGGHYNVLNFGPCLASVGFVVAAPDSPLAGERYDPLRQGAYDTREQAARDPSWSLLGQRLHDHMRVVDYLQSLPFVDPARIGAIGHSCGGESTMMLTAMDDRVRAAVVSCGGTLLRTFEAAADTYALPESLILSLNWRKLLQAPVGQRQLPFDFDDCMALWSPRPVFMHDVRQELWPNAAQVAQAAVETAKLYQLAGAPERFCVVYSDQTHCFPQWVQPDAFDWLAYWLKGSAPEAESGTDPR